jgi:integrase
MQQYYATNITVCRDIIAAWQSPPARTICTFSAATLKNCTRYPAGAKQPFTQKPATPKDKMADTCACPIWCLGYLAKETRTVNGKVKPKRVFLSFGTAEWTTAETATADLYTRGSVPATTTATGKPIDRATITVIYAGERFLMSRTGGSMNPVEKDTYEHYRSLIHDRLIPWCDQKGIGHIKEFQNQDVCSQFTESWRQMRRDVGALLAMSTRKIMFARFKTLLKYCVENEWMSKSGAKKLKTKLRTTAKEEERYGLELAEYQQMLEAPDSADLTPQENQETLAATELMRWAGLRISDAHKFNATEIVPNETGDGWNASFVQKKTKRRSVSPLPEHVVELLNTLPGHMDGGKKYFFTCSYTALRERVTTLAYRAQQDKPFAHHFSPHCLRYTFAIQHLNEGTPVELVSKWLGHESVAVTMKHYRNWIHTTRTLAEKTSREANARMRAKVAALQH